MIKVSEMNALRERGQRLAKARVQLDRLSTSRVEPTLVGCDVRGNGLEIDATRYLPPSIQTAIVALAIQGVRQFVETETKALTELGIDPDA